MDNMEAESYETNGRSNNIGTSDNHETAMLDKIATNIEANSSKAETTETTGVGDRDDAGLND